MQSVACQPLCRFKQHLKQRQAGEADVNSYDMHKRIEKWYWKQVIVHFSRHRGVAELQG